MTVRYPVTKPFFDDKEMSLISGTLESGWVAQGPKVAEFEKAVARHEGVAEGVATTSCTTALHLAMVTKGVKTGMDVLVPAFTFVATANSVVMSGGVPVFVDICRDTFNMDPDKLKNTIDTMYDNRSGKLVNRVSGNELWGMVPVHQFGLCCDIESVNRIASEYGLSVIEDAACALGATVNGVHQGAFGNISCVSFHPRKSITTGEGGMILSDNTAEAKRMRELRTHGATISADSRDKGKGFLLPEFNEAGFNYRMTDIQGAMGLAQMEKLDHIISEKRKAARIYNDIIPDILPEFITPSEPEGFMHTYQSYVCMLDIDRIPADSIEKGGEYRNMLLTKLEDAGIATRQGTHAVHTLGYYRERFAYRPEDYINAYTCDRLSITLPLYVGITPEDQKTIIETTRRTIDEM